MKRRVHSPADVADVAGDKLLTPHEVAVLFGVGPKTLGRWARQGRIAAQWTLGGHRRFAAAEVARCLTEIGAGGQPDEDGQP
jgi:excisionase family DNA binding protein